MHDAAREEDRRGEPDAEALYSAHLARLEAGGTEGFEDLLRRHPGAADELRELHRGYQALHGRLERMGRELEALGGNGLLPRQRVAGFRLVRRLGRGAMGEVWLADEPALARRVALKLLLPERLTERGIGFFEREARAGAKVQHPGIVTVHAAGRGEGLFWIAQEHVEGERTLADLLREARAHPRPSAGWFRQVAELFRELARALGAAHEVGVVHRDLKPRNVLIDRDGRPKVADFGLARILDEQSLSRSGDVVGTYSYMAPEQLSGRREEVDARSDVFSLGVVLYEALTRTRPFEAETTTALAARVLTHEPPDPRAIDALVPRDLAVICKKAIEKAPAHRFQSMGELADELERFLEHRPIRTRPPGPLGRGERWLRRHPARGALLGVIGLAALVTGSLLMSNVDFRGRLTQRGLDHAYLAASYGEVEAAEEALAQARTLDPRDPLPHLLLAWAWSRVGSVDEILGELEAASALGFEPEARGPAPAIERLGRGLYHWMRGNWVAAEPELAAAVESDARLRAAAYPLYEVREGLGDPDGARAALALYDDVRLNRAEAALVRALRLELDGRYAEAVATLRGAELEELRHLHPHRVLGRLLLFTGEPAGAVDALREAVAARPQDGPSWANLALALWLAPGSEDEARREELVAVCERMPRRPLARVLLASVALDRLEERLDEIGPPPGPEWNALDRRVDELRAVAPGHPVLAELESHRLTFEAAALAGEGMYDEALALLERALERDPENLRARVLLAQELALTEGDPAGALGQLELALASWDRAESAPPPSPADPNIARRWPRRWLQAAEVWRFYTAGLAGDDAAAEEAKDAVEDELGSGAELPLEELATYVEALATTPIDELKDCARALELLDEHDLRARLADVPGGSDLLAAVDGACR